jgi:hypothetical protein
MIDDLVDQSLSTIAEIATPDDAESLAGGGIEVQGEAFSNPDGGRMSIMDPPLPQFQDEFQDEVSSVSVKPRKRRIYGVAILLCLLVVALFGVVAGVMGRKNGRDHQASTTNNESSKAVGSDSENENENSSDAGVEGGPSTVDSDVDADDGSDGGVVDGDSPGVSDVESGGAGSPTTGAPSLSPTPCTNHLIIGKSCHVHKSDNIAVDFAQCTPQQNDWIGIYREGSNPKNLQENFAEWSWTCGKDYCQGEVFRAELLLPTAIPPGHYKAYLVRDNPNGPPYHSDIASDMFEVASTCSE